MAGKCSIVLFLLFIAASVINSNAERLNSSSSSPCRGVRALLYKCHHSKKGRRGTKTKTEETDYNSSPNLQPMSPADKQKTMTFFLSKASKDAEQYRREQESSPSPSVASPPVIPPSPSVASPPVIPPSPSVASPPVIPPSPSVASPPVIPPSPSVASPSVIAPSPSVASPSVIAPSPSVLSLPIVESVESVEPPASTSVPEPADSPESALAIESVDWTASTPVTEPVEPPASPSVVETADPPALTPVLEPVKPPSSPPVLEPAPVPVPSTESTEAIESAEAISPLEEVPSPSLTITSPVGSRPIRPTPSIAPTKAEDPEKPKEPSASPASESIVGLASAADPQKNPESGHHMNHTVKVVCIVLASVCLAVVVIGNMFGLYYTYVHRSRDIDLALLE